MLYTAYDNESNELRLFDADSGTIVASLPSSFGQISGDCTLSKDESTGFSSNAGRNISVFNFSDAALGNGVDVTSIEISNAGVGMSLEGRVPVQNPLQLTVRFVSENV